MSDGRDNRFGAHIFTATAVLSSVVTDINIAFDFRQKQLHLCDKISQVEESFRFIIQKIKTIYSYYV